MVAFGEPLRALSLGFGGIDNGRSGRGSRQILVEMAPAACSGLGVPWPHGRHLRAMDFLETGRPDVDKDEDEVIRHRASWRMQRKGKSDPSRDRCGLSVGAGVAGVQLGWQETHEARSTKQPQPARNRSLPSCPALPCNRRLSPTHGPYRLRVRPACGTRVGRLKARLRTLPVFHRVKCTAQHNSGNNTSKQPEMALSPLPYHPRHFNSLPAQNPTSCRHFRPSQDSAQPPPPWRHIYENGANPA
jgi:hypothetical protein